MEPDDSITRLILDHFSRRENLILEANHQISLITVVPTRESLPLFTKTNYLTGQGILDYEPLVWLGTEDSFKNPDIRSKQWLRNTFQVENDSDVALRIPHFACYWLLLPQNLLAIDQNNFVQKLQDCFIQCLKTSLFHEISKIFNLQYLSGIENEQILVSKYIDFLLPWVTPKAIPFTQTPYCSFWETTYPQTSLLCAIDFEKEVKWNIPEFNSDFQELNKFVEFYFEHSLFPRWRDSKVKRPVDHAVVENKLELIQNYLEEIRDDLRYAPRTGTAVAGQASYDQFSFFNETGRQDWIIYFHGVKVGTRGKNPKTGLDAIRALLQNPGIQLIPLNLKRMNRFGYNSKEDIDALIANRLVIDKDKANYEELNTRLEKLPEEQANEIAGNRELRIFWKYRILLLKAKLLHKPWARQDQIALVNAKRNLSEITTEIDNNFAEPEFKEINEEINALKPKIDIHRITDGLQKNIRNAIDALDYEPLQDYLRATLILVSKENSSPFIYLPELAHTKEPSKYSKNALPWNTGEYIAQPFFDDLNIGINPAFDPNDTLDDE